MGCFCVEGKTEGYKSTLKRWNEEQFGNVRKNQKCIFQELNELELKEDVQFLNGWEYCNILEISTRSLRKRCILNDYI